MTDDPDEIKAEMEARRRAIAEGNPIALTQLNLEAIESHLRYGIPALKMIGWIIIVLLALILWRLWPELSRYISN